MKNKLFIISIVLVLFQAGQAFAAPCQVTNNKDEGDSGYNSSSLRYIIDEFINNRSNGSCDATDGSGQSVVFYGERKITIDSDGIIFDLKSGIESLDLGAEDGSTLSKIDGQDLDAGVSPFQCDESTSADVKVSLSHLVILTNGIDQADFFKDCLVEGEQVFVCDAVNNEYDDEVTPGADGWCGGSNLPDIQLGEPILVIDIKYADTDEDGYGDPNEGRNCLFGITLERLGFIDDASDYCEGYVTDKTDCNDTDDAIHPNAEESCNGVDDDCDGQIDEGFDEDGDGYTTCEGDCDDTSATTYPSAEETCEDGIDQDCDGLDTTCVEDDADGDGYTEDQNDCDDTNPEINPGETEICDGIDNNCDGNVDGGNVCEGDADGDGYISDEETDGTDCNDNDAAINPAATEICGDGIDQDCSGADLSCSVEICDSGVDNDGDGLIGCDDPDCIMDPLCSITVQETECADGLDNDSDGDIDCADSDCYNVVIDEASGTTCASMSVNLVGDGGDVVGGANIVGGCALGGVAGQGGSAGIGWLIAALAFLRSVKGKYF